MWFLRYVPEQPLSETEWMCLKGLCHVYTTKQMNWYRESNNHMKKSKWSHELGSEVVDQSAQSHPGPPGLCEICYSHIFITRCVFLAPFQQLLKTTGRICGGNKGNSSERALRPQWGGFHSHKHLFLGCVNIVKENVLLLWCWSQCDATVTSLNNRGLERLHSEEELTLTQVRKPILLFLARWIGFINDV